MSILYTSNVFGAPTNAVSPFPTTYTTGVVTASDININGVMLSDQMHKLQQSIVRIEERLGIIEFSSEFEKRFEQLRQLGEQYRQLLDELKEQDKTWEILNR